MNFSEYENEARKTIPVELSTSELIDDAVYGLCGELGELVDILKKTKFQGHPWTDETRIHAISELGDIMWYLSAMATGLGVSLEEVVQLNIEKLRQRYGEHFDTDKSQHRKEGDI